MLFLSPAADPVIKEQSLSNSDNNMVSSGNTTARWNTGKNDSLVTVYFDDFLDLDVKIQKSSIIYVIKATPSRIWEYTNVYLPSDSRTLSWMWNTNCTSFHCVFKTKLNPPLKPPQCAVARRYMPYSASQDRVMKMGDKLKEKQTVTLYASICICYSVFLHSFIWVLPLICHPSVLPTASFMGVYTVYYTEKIRHF